MNEVQKIADEMLAVKAPDFGSATAREAIHRWADRLSALTAEAGKGLPELPEPCWVSEQPVDAPLYTADQMREYARLALSTATPAGEWREIESAPYGESVWVFDAASDPQQYAATITEGAEGPYWRPDESLVADVLCEYLRPTHWRPLPSPPALQEPRKP